MDNNSQASRDRRDQPSWPVETTDVDSDIVETSAVDCTSGDNNGHDSFDHSDDLESNRDSDNMDARSTGRNHTENSDHEHNSLKLSEDANNNSAANQSSHNIVGPRPNNRQHPESIPHSNNVGGRSVNAKLISRRRRSHRRQRNTNDFGDYDHDGDIDRSDDDEADNDGSSDYCDSNSDISDDEDAAQHSSIGNRWRQENKANMFLRQRALPRNRQQQQESKVQDSMSNVENFRPSSSHDRVSFDGPSNNNQKQSTSLDHAASHDYVSQCNSIGSVFGRAVSFVKALLPGSTSDPVPQQVVSSRKWAQGKHRKGLNIYSSSPDKQSCMDNQQQVTNMPNHNIKYQTLHSLEEYRAPRKSSSKTPGKTRESQRLVDSNGYSKLSHHHYQRSTPGYSILQELKRIILLVIIVSICCLILWKLHDILTDDFNYLGVVDSPSELGKFKHYAVSTDAEPCSKVGRALLDKGGSAVDAAIGTLICMGIALPNSLGLGGGCFMTIYDRKKKEAVVIDGREVAPSFAHENMFAENPLAASRGPLSVGVPGEIAAYWKAHQMYGKLNWSELFDQSIEMADNGSPIVRHLSSGLRDITHAKYISPPLAKLFTNSKTGEYYLEGEVMQQKALAQTLRRLRDNGAKEFYGGQTGQQFVEDLRKQGGNITMDDLMKYEALVKEPLKFDFDEDLRLYTQPLPGSGLVLSIILRIMKELGYYKGIKPQTSLESASLYYHRLVEAYKFAYAQRAGLEDKPDDPARLTELTSKLMSDDYIKDAASKIDSVAHDISYYGGQEFFSEDHGTAHVSVMDADGNAASVTSSVNLYFGSGLYSPSTGIIYNDVMDDFVSPNITNKFKLAPSKYNRIRPGKRPLSSMSPSVFTDSAGNVRLIIGASGGTLITTSIASVSLRHCFLGDDLKTAVDGPRMHHQYLPNHVSYEANFNPDILHLMAQRGHELEPIRGRSSVIMAIANQQVGDKKYVTANSDYRKGGTVDGI